MIKAITTGSIPVQHACISWSYRIRGNVARNHTKIKQNRHVLSARTILCTLMKVSFDIISGMIYPPMKRMAVNADIRTMLQYSARKKKTKIIPLCSVKNPATSSDSASGRSKGVRLVSARTDIKKIINRGKSGTKNHTLCWLSIIVV